MSSLPTTVLHQTAAVTAPLLVPRHDLLMDKKVQTVVLKTFWIILVYLVLSH